MSDQMMTPGQAPTGSKTGPWPRCSRTPDESQFLEGPKQRRFELLRAFRIMTEFIRGFRRLHFVGPCVTIFGSARFPQEHPYCVLARQTAAKVASLGFTIMTGGGPGIMEAANHGARDAGGHSIGCNIQLPHEQKPNPHLDTFVEFRYFFVRKVMLVKYSYAFVVLPGGFGTLDEVFETAVLIQTGKISNFPIILMGTDYWAPLMSFVRETLVKQGAIDAMDPDLLQLTDSPDEAARLIQESAIKQFGFKWSPKKPKRRWFLLER